jgi:hypothetical protein
MFNGLRVNMKNKNLLKSRYYSLYNIVEGKTKAVVISYKRDEYLTA